VLQPLGVTLLVLVLLVGFAALPRLFHVVEPEMVGKDVPAFEVPVAAQGSVLKLPNDKQFVLADLKGKAVVLDFWATRCGPCQAEIPIVDGVARRMQGRDVVVVGVNTSDDEDSLSMWLEKKKGLAFPILFDGTDASGKLFGVRQLPTLIVVSKIGKVVGMRIGVTDASELERLIEKALK
jgi:thiol-disulfide isomerase/thioredoxin